MWDDELAHQVITRDVSSRHATDVALRYQAALVNHVSDAIIGTTRRAWSPVGTPPPRQSTVTPPTRRTAHSSASRSALRWIRSRSLHRAESCTAPTAVADGTSLDVRVSAAAMDERICVRLLRPDRSAPRRTAFETVVDAMSKAHPHRQDGRIKSINPAAVQIMGTGPEYLGGDFFAITGQLPFYDSDGVNIPADCGPPGSVANRCAVLQSGVRVRQDRWSPHVVDVELPSAEPRHAGAIRHADVVHRCHRRT